MSGGTHQGLEYTRSVYDVDLRELWDMKMDSPFPGVHIAFSQNSTPNWSSRLSQRSGADMRVEVRVNCQGNIAEEEI